MKKPWRVVCLVALLSFQSGFAGAAAQPRSAQIFVTPTGTGTQCTVNAPCSLQDGVDQSDPGDTVYVAPGTYTASFPADEVVRINKDLTIWGRCLFGPGQTLSCQRDNPETVLDGEWNRRGITIQGGPGNAVDVTLYYLKVQNGFADDNVVNLTACTPDWVYAPTGCGGGLFADQAGQIMIVGSHFRENQGSGSSPVGNQGGYGGAIYIQDSQDVHLSASQVIDNRAVNSGPGFGGGIYAEGISGTLWIQDVLLQANESSQDSAVGIGAGLAVLDAGRVVVEGTSFHGNNQAFQVLIDGSAAAFRYVDSLQFNKNLILVNYGGSAVHFLGQSLSQEQMIYRNRFWDNATTENLRLTGSYTANIFNNFFHMAVPIREGRGGSVVNLHLTGVGCTGNSTASVFHNSFGMGETGILVGDYLNVRIKGNIIANQEILGISIYGAMFTASEIDYNLFHNNGDHGDTGNHALIGDPAFFNPGMGDLHIEADSAAVDAAPEFTLPLGGGDFDGDPRPIGLDPLPCDLGADERVLWGYLPYVGRE